MHHITLKRVVNFTLSVWDGCINAFGWIQRILLYYLCKDQKFRLELLAASIEARLRAPIFEALQLSLKTRYWTDSNIMLSCNVNKEYWSTFVGIRGKKSAVWQRYRTGDMFLGKCRHVLVTDELLKSQWWDRPSCLGESEETFPQVNIPSSDEAFLEQRKIAVGNVNADI